MSLVFFVAKLNQNAICFWGLPPLQRVFSNFKKNRQKKQCIWTGFARFRVPAPAGRQTTEGLQKIKKIKITVLSVL